MGYGRGLKKHGNTGKLGMGKWAMGYVWDMGVWDMGVWDMGTQNRTGKWLIIFLTVPPVNIPILRKIESNMGGAPGWRRCAKMVPLVLTHGNISKNRL